jgi:hypothetical protein
VGCVQLGLSIFGLGDLLTPFERPACRQADPGYSAADQLANTGGALDNLLSTVGLLAMVAASFVPATAMKRLPRWAGWVRPVRRFAIVVVALFVGTAVSGPASWTGCSTVWWPQWVPRAPSRSVRASYGTQTTEPHGKPARVPCDPPAEGAADAGARAPRP